MLAMSGYSHEKAQVPLPKMLLERLRVSLHLVPLSKVLQLALDGKMGLSVATKYN